MHPYSDVTANAEHGALFKQILIINKNISREGAAAMVALVTLPENKPTPPPPSYHSFSQKLLIFTLTRHVQMSVNSLLSKHRMFFLKGESWTWAENKPPVNRNGQGNLRRNMFGFKNR